MTRRPFDPDELDRPELELDGVAEELQRYARLTAGEAPHGLDERVMAALADEPPPRRGLLALLLAPFGGRTQGGMSRAIMIGATMALAILAVVVAGELAGLLGNDQLGPSPVPTLAETPSPTPSPSPTIRPTPTGTPSPSLTPEPTVPPTPTPRPSLAETPESTPQPTAHETPDGEDDHSETPSPSDSGNSGPGGSDDDSS